MISQPTSLNSAAEESTMKMIRSLGMTLVLAGSALVAGCDRPSGSVTDEGIALAEEKGCIACHGLNGKGTGPTFPNINKQWPSYVRTQLLKYRDGSRVNAIMNGQAAELSDHDINVLARYYSGQ